MTGTGSRWLVFGASGQVGSALCGLPLDGPCIVAADRSAFDLTDTLDGLDRMLEAEAITAIVNCAAYTQVDRAESEPDLAFALNARAPGIMADAARRAGIPLIHLSTDYVFSGDKAEPYREDDPTGPLGVYGQSKLAGEQAVRNSEAQHAIIRTAWVISSTGHNFVKTMLRLGEERSELAVVSDQIGCPTSARDLAEAVATITAALEAGRGSGTWHVVNDGEASWYQLACHVFESATRFGSPRPEVRPISSSEYPTPAPRPANSRLATAKVGLDFGITLRPWREAVADVVEELVHPLPGASK